jgi:hypothetical protein
VVSSFACSFRGVDTTNAEATPTSPRISAVEASVTMREPAAEDSSRPASAGTSSASSRRAREVPKERQVGRGSGGGAEVRLDRAQQLSNADPHPPFAYPRRRALQQAAEASTNRPSKARI